MSPQAMTVITKHDHDAGFYPDTLGLGVNWTGWGKVGNPGAVQCALCTQRGPGQGVWVKPPRS